MLEKSEKSEKTEVHEVHEVHPRHVIHFLKADTDCKQDLLEFLRSEVI